MAELKPCPFCGCKAIMETFQVAREKSPRYRVRCTGKDCRISLDWDWWSEAEAREVWNRRTIDEKNNH